MKLNYTKLKQKNEIIQCIRRWFDSQSILEIETRLLNPTPTVEAHLDSFQLTRTGVRKSPDAQKENLHSYLITSPEYNLKKVLAQVQNNIFQIAHSFREGDIGTWHREEFLMLEWYLVDTNLSGLMDFCESFIMMLTKQPTCQIPVSIERISIDDLFQKYLNCGTSTQDLQKIALAHKLISNTSNGSIENAVQKTEYDDLFFIVFLNLIDPHLRNDIFFLYDFPKSLAALSKIKNDKAQRFEIYWNGIEIANGYEELQSAQDYQAAFDRENKHRKRIQKPHALIDNNLLRILEKEKGLPMCSGIALGLDRLLAILFQETNIHDNNSMSI